MGCCGHAHNRPRHFLRHWHHHCWVSNIVLRTLIVVAAACAVVYTISYCCTLPSRRAQELLILLGSVTSGGASSEVGQVLLDDVMAHKTELRLLHPDRLKPTS